MPIYPNNNALFTDIWNDSTGFINEYRDSGLNKATMTDESLNILYYQLYAKHGGDHIKYRDLHQWKYMCFSIIFNEGVKWQTARVKQNELESLTENEILFGGKSTTNRSSNPSVANQTNDNDDGLATIDDQNVSINKMNKAVAYAGYITTLKDVTTAFISKFDKLFSINVFDPGMVIYENEEEE